MITDEQYARWLANGRASRVLLIELHHADGVEYVADAPYNRPLSDNTGHRVYEGLVDEVFSIEQRIDGQARYGDLTLIDDGAISHWAEYAWRGHPIRMYLGDPDWPRDDFRAYMTQLYNGGLTAVQDGELTFAVHDSSFRLDETIETGELPDDQGPVPFVYGQCFNVPVTRTDSQTLTYTASWLPLTSIQARDLGEPVPGTLTDDATGVLLDNSTSRTRLTADVHEPHDTPAALVRWIAEHYGYAGSVCELPDVLVGNYYASPPTGATLLQDLCDSFGAYWDIDDDDRIVLRRIEVPTETAEVMITADDMSEDGPTLDSIEPPWPKLTLRYDHNPSPLDQIAGAIEYGDDPDPALASRLRNEWRESTASPEGFDAARYPRAEPVERNTVIVNEADAVAERDRLLVLHAIPRRIWSIDCNFVRVRMGQTVAVEDDRVPGNGRVVSISNSPTEATTTLEVWL